MKIITELLNLTTKTELFFILFTINVIVLLIALYYVERVWKNKYEDLKKKLKELEKNIAK